MKTDCPFTFFIRMVLFALAWAIAIPSAAGAGLTLAAGGRTHYEIVIASNASPTVKNAAHELSGDLRKISGTAFAVTSDHASDPAIYVGSGKAFAAAFPKLPLHLLPKEGFIIRTSGKNLVLAGKDARGTQYAVYTFLEDQLGVRWYSPQDTVIPQRRVVRIPFLNIRQAPAFIYRDTNEFLTLHHPQWDVHLKLNGADVPYRASLGGTYPLFNGSQNFYELVPPSKYFSVHPEYFSLINGKRSDRQAWPSSQLSLVNPSVFRIITKRLVEQAKAAPWLLALGLSPNDSPGGNSQGAGSKASDAHYGAPSGTLLNLVNRVASAVQKQLPDRKIWLETLAYHYTEKPPKPGTIKAGPNVLVCYAPIGMDFGRSIAALDNHTKLKYLLGWDKVASGHLQIWYYATDFSNYLQPFPDWDGLGADMEFFHQHGVSGIFCEGNYNSPGEMMVMRTWVMAHLMWNPRENVWHLVKEFSNGYYGAAGRYIYRYLRVLHHQLRRSNTPLSCNASYHVAFLTPQVLSQADRLLETAEAVVKANRDELKRVKEARIGIRYVELMSRRPNGHSSSAAKAAFRLRLSRFLQTIKQFGVTRISEDQTVSQWAAIMKEAAR